MLSLQDHVWQFNITSMVCLFVFCLHFSQLDGRGMAEQLPWLIPRTQQHQVLWYSVSSCDRRPAKLHGLEKQECCGSGQKSGRACTCMIIRRGKESGGGEHRNGGAVIGVRGGGGGGGQKYSYSEALWMPHS